LANIDHNRQKKAAVINDYSSFGRCSLAVASPILSAMKVQCCPVPTAVFTNHTGFPRFSWRDLTEVMDTYLEDWQAIGLEFTAIASGFLGSRRQIDFVKRFVKAFSKSAPLVLIDPVMGDYGRLYPSYAPELAAGMHELLDIADVLTPNLTEASILIGREYNQNAGERELEEIARELCEPHARCVVISGIPRGSELLNFIYERDKGCDVLVTQRIGEDRSGTGDVFSAVVLGRLLNGAPFKNAVRDGAAFVMHAIRRSIEMGIPVTDGLAFEEVLGELIP